MVLCPFILLAQSSENLKKRIKLFEAEKYTEAKSYFTKDIKNNSEYFESYLCLGKILIHKKNFEEATEKLNIVVERASEFSDARL